MTITITDESLKEMTWDELKAAEATLRAEWDALTDAIKNAGMWADTKEMKSEAFRKGIATSRVSAEKAKRPEAYR